MESWDKDVRNEVTSLSAAENALSEETELAGVARKSFAAREIHLK
jgi:hypothetical protein